MPVEVVDEEQMFRILKAAWIRCDSLQAVFHGLDADTFTLETPLYEQPGLLQSLDPEDYEVWALELGDCLRQLRIQGIKDPSLAFENDAKTIGDVVRNLLAMEPTFVV
ncbi:hypothetical protein KKC88_00200 [Patescibacteria group bacterium]|nr:hypothetical protein [Patescibacteria group bacterium]MBU1673442.1 hypothetical protein [Patescibacteria group bacterium]MBU1963357.1 hypothetical protein [Patescibacteria group bacterium]